MVTIHHYFDCAVCCEGENPRRYGEGEFRRMKIELPDDYHGRTPPPRLLNLCHKHYEVLNSLVEWDRWEAFRRLCYEEQEGPEPEYVHPVDESEERDD